MTDMNKTNKPKWWETGYWELSGADLMICCGKGQNNIVMDIEGIKYIINYKTADAIKLVIKNCCWSEKVKKNWADRKKNIARELYDSFNEMTKTTDGTREWCENYKKWLDENHSGWEKTHKKWAEDKYYGGLTREQYLDKL